MAQRIIVIHGRSTKPAKAPYAQLQRQALLHGLESVDPAKAAKVSDRTVEVDFVYYGDVNNHILATQSDKVADELTETDPHSNDAPCLPTDKYEEALSVLSEIKHHNKATYKKLVREADDLRFLDDAAWAVSTLSSLVTGGFLNMVGIKYATADMGAYLTTRAVGSEVRERLQDPLRRAMKRGDDICLVSHSMGCMVSYDVLWKFSRMSEYKSLRDTDGVSRWITLGCPLGEAGVKANLYDSDERDTEDGTDKHPKDIVKDWINVAAHDDFISHDRTMKNDFKPMLKYEYEDSITDHTIYNCYTEQGEDSSRRVMNPHKFYGYLANPACAKHIANWIV